MKTYNGLGTKEVLESRNRNGSNKLTQVEKDPLWKQLLEGFKDPMIVVLLVAFVIQIVFWVMGRADWFEAVGILVAICIANFVGVFSENKQEGKAAQLRAEEQAKERAKVIRDGALHEIALNDVVVGDIVVLQAGDKVPADGVILEGNIKVDQAALNGETEEAEKTEITTDIQDYLKTADTKNLLNASYIYRGTVVMQGEAYMQVVLVGDKTIYGELALEMQEDTRDTPLKVKLSKLAKQISKFGYIGAGFIFVAFLAQNLLTGNVPSDFIGWFQLGIEGISLAVVIIVMAVPEGLPMMISMVLAMNMGKMLKNNVLVRKLNGIETAGGLNILFSDKTGTITEGKLSVVEISSSASTYSVLQKASANSAVIDKFSDFTEDTKNALVIGLGVNNGATLSGEDIIGGNSTDRALLTYFKSQGVKDITHVGVVASEPFDSAKKFATVTLGKDTNAIKYIKGAPEKIVTLCKTWMDGTPVDQDVLVKYMDTQASKSMRLLAVAMTEDTTSDTMTAECKLVGIVSIRDNVRSEAITAIAEVCAAGVQVVMVTGDRKETAVAIAKEAGLLRVPTDVVLTSAEMGELTDAELKVILPNLRVVARALPLDKSRLVNLAQELDLVVGMTGDGVNDSPALKKADVGFAMGSGTEVAKEAGDITILDDNFKSIGDAILYGRTIMCNIRKFLIFQLTVNVSTVLLCFIAPFLGIAQPLSIITILYINLVMDTLAALAFGNEPALKRYMNAAPISRSESILTKRMASQVLTIGGYIVVVSMLILNLPALWNFINPSETWGNIQGLMFAPSEEFREAAMLAFMMFTVILNGFYARSEGVNAFEHIGENKAFLIVMSAVALLLVVLIELLYGVMGLAPLPLETWCMTFILALGSIPVDMLRKTIMRTNKSK